MNIFIMSMNFFMFTINITSMLFLMMTYYMKKMNPFKQMISLLMYMIFLFFEINYFKKDELSTLMIMFAFLSGIFILFAYFLSLINNYTNLNAFNMILICSMIIIISIMMMIIVVQFNNNLHLIKMEYMEIDIQKLYLIYFIPLMNMFLLSIILLLMMLYISYKICFTKKKNLRKIK